MSTVEFTLTDCDGEPHTYDVTPHPPTEGTSLCVQVLGAAGEPIGRLLASNLDKVAELLPKAIAKAEQAEDDAELKAALEDDFGDLSEVFEDLDVDLAQIVRDVQTAIVEAGEAEFFRRLFKHTYRDGEALASKSAYNQAFQANYSELFQAAWKVIRANGFLPLLATLK